MSVLLKDIITYLKHPALVKIPSKIQSPGALLLKLTFICLVLGICSGTFSGVLIQLGLVPDHGPSLLERKNVSGLMLVAGPLVLGPLMEELVFRAQLRRFTGSVFFLALVPGLILKAITGTNWAFLISPFIFIVLFLVYRFTLAGSVTRKFQFWKAVFPWHFHLTSICFALVHLGNFEKGTTLLPFGILYTLPQLAAGLIFGYTRMNYGLKYSIALHALYNFLPAILIFSKY